MSEKNTISRAFNNHFIELLNDLITIYPDNVEILTAKSSFETFKKLNPSAIVKVWYNYVYKPYNEYIEAGNMDYFLNKNYQDDLAYVNNSNEVLNMVERVKVPLRQLDGANKDHTIEYLKNLNKLSLAYATINGSL